jgi:hypothetical protein
MRVVVNEKGPFAFLLSPQAETTLIDRSLAADLGLKPRHPGMGGSQLEVGLQLGSTKLSNVPAALTDMAQWIPEFGPATRPRGILSLSIWKNQVVTIDYPRWRVTVEPGALPESNGKDVFDLTPTRELVLPLFIDGQSLSCRIDPLYSGGILLPAAYVKTLPVIGRILTVGAINTPHGVLEVQEAQLGLNIRLGSFEILTPVVRFAQSLPTAMAGGHWLANFSIAYDGANGRARLERPGETRQSVAAETSHPSS